MVGESISIPSHFLTASGAQSSVCANEPGKDGIAVSFHHFSCKTTSLDLRIANKHNATKVLRIHDQFGVDTVTISSFDCIYIFIYVLYYYRLKPSGSRLKLSGATVWYFASTTSSLTSQRREASTTRLTSRPCDGDAPTNAARALHAPTGCGRTRSVKVLSAGNVVWSGRSPPMVSPGDPQPGPHGSRSKGKSPSLHPQDWGLGKMAESIRPSRPRQTCSLPHGAPLTQSFNNSWNSWESSPRNRILSQISRMSSRKTFPNFQPQSRPW